MNHEIRCRSFGIVGGDLRQAALAGGLAGQGFPVHTYGLDQAPELTPATVGEGSLDFLRGMDVVVLPLPVTTDGSSVNAPFAKGSIPLEEVLSTARPGALMLGGRVPQAVAELAASHGFAMVDYLEREELAVLNAIPTAEGAVGIAMGEQATTLWGSRCLVTGFGRIAKVLARMLSSLGATVTVAARREEDLAWVRVMGWTPVRISQMESLLGQQDIVFNTVPSVVLDRRRLSLLDSGCLVVDLASKPGGVDFDTARELGVRTVWALSLPGKVAPITAGNIIRDTIINIIREREDGWRR